MQELSGVTVVIIITLGVLTFLILFIFAKRQIMRFALRSRRGPHIPIGHDAPKVLKKEIERRVDLIPKIMCEPKVLGKEDSRYILVPGQQIPAHYYRLKAVDDVKILEKEISRQDPELSRHPSENLRAYLLSTLAAALSGSGQRLIHQCCDLYEHARHDPNVFGDEEYQAFRRLLLKLLDAAKMFKSYNRKFSPNRTTPVKQKERNRNLLDPSRLKQPSPENEVLCVSETMDSRPASLSIIIPFADTETSV